MSKRQCKRKGQQKTTPKGKQWGHGPDIKKRIDDAFVDKQATLDNRYKVKNDILN